MLTPEQLDRLPASFIALYHEFEDSVLADIARRLAALDMTATAAWQTQRLIASGALYEHILRELSMLTGRSQAELRKLFQSAGVRSIRFDDGIYRDAGLNPLPLNLSPQMSQILAAAIQRTAGAVANLTATTALAGQQAFVHAADLAFLQVSSGTFSYDQAIRAAVSSVGESGLGVIYPSGRVDKLDVAMRRTVLTGVGQTAGQLQEARADEMGQDLVQVSAHVGARPSHQIWQGKIYSRSGTHPRYPNFVAETGYGTGPGLGGWNCVLGDTLVSSLAKRAAYRREYSGEVLILHTAAGKRLTVTPNHPILTDHGWVAAKFLRHGDNVICRTSPNGQFRPGPDIDQSEARIQDVFDSLCVSGKHFRLPVSSSHFHGDISNGEVEIVFADGFLGDDIHSLAEQELLEIGLGFSPGDARALAANSALSQIAKSALHSPYGIVGVFGKLQAFAGGHTLESFAHSLRAVFGKWYAELGEIFTNRPLGYAGLGGNFVFPHARVVHRKQVFGLDIEAPLDVRAPIHASIHAQADKGVLGGFPGAAEIIRNYIHGYTGVIEADQVILVERKSTQGSFVHVYNLQTEGEWYSANGIITHNCRHSYYPFFDGISKNAYDEATRGELERPTVEYNGRELSVYEASQVQRGIERKIREWKRRANVLEAAGMDASGELLKVRSWQARMRDFVAKTGLNRQPVRELV